MENVVNVNDNVCKCNGPYKQYLEVLRTDCSVKQMLETPFPGS